MRTQSDLSYGDAVWIIATTVGYGDAYISTFVTTSMRMMGNVPRAGLSLVAG